MEFKAVSFGPIFFKYSDLMNVSKAPTVILLNFHNVLEHRHDLLL